MQPAPPGASTCPTCGGVLEETPGGGLGCLSCLLGAGVGSEEVTQDSSPAGHFGVYEIDRHPDGSLYELGRGAMGVTYRATDTSLQRKVALKIIKIDIATRSADARERFIREARAAAALRHENIATIHHFGMRLETGQYFYAMELLEGETLDERVRRAGPVDVRATIEIAQQVTSALAAAEERGLVHRDLKPANLMLVSRGRERASTNPKDERPLVKIIDFGLAKALNTPVDPKSLTHDRFVGTPAFASPEQFDHSALDVRSDIYSLGETLWFALTGKAPFAGHTLSEIHRAQKSSVLPLEQLKAAHVPSGLRSLLESMLAFEPASRPGTHELAARLRRCSEKRSFFAELKRRNVYKVAAAYAVAAWLLIQAASILFPTFDAPPWLMQIFVVILVIGFPAALVFSWAFEITPEGIVRESEVEHGKPITRRTGRKIVAMTVVLAIFAAGLLIFQVLRARSTMAPRQSEATTAIPEKGIAVLPFENRSEDKANAYFADGIQDEILTRLSNIADLRVISRTSTRQYQSKPPNLREIAKQLGVANIVEGSVQKVANQVRVNVQLINAQTDSHLWGDTYDRNLTDIFGVESEIAKRIAESLQARLTGREEQALAVKPTNNPEAYDAYLRGLAFELRTISPDSFEKSVGFYERAVQLDPAFALAWARLSRANASNYSASLGSTIAHRDAAERALNMAQKLQPNSPETLLAQAYYQYWVLRDDELAKATFGRVRELLPGSSDVPGALALIARRQGHWDESVAYWEQTLALDPRNTDWLARAANTYAMLRQFPAALKTYDRLLDIVPNDPDTVASEAKIYQAEGNLEQAGKLLAGINAQTPSFMAYQTKMNQLFLERHFDEAIRLIHSRLTETRDLSDFEKLFNPFDLVLAKVYAGDTGGARATAQQLLGPLDTFGQKDPDNLILVLVLPIIHAVLGQKDAAIKEAERATMLRPSGKDAVMGPWAEENLAFVEALVGDKNRAIPRLQRLLEIPWVGYLTPALLRLHPNWDPLRSDPRFQKLCEDNPSLLSMPTQIPEKSIAVLPFENLSDEKTNAYFADGIQNEILTRLTNVGDLKVISRTSTAKYQSKPDNLRTIAQELGVSTILEGAVQKAGDKVRVNVQLINAQTDSHLWADTYDRKLTDIFGVETEIAKRIAESLQAKLTGHEQQALAVKPTNNPEAYDAYLRGVAFETRFLFEGGMQWKAIDSYERAVQLDPNFALAWARLSRMHAMLYFNSGGTTPSQREAAKKALENAQRLVPDSPETLLALGYYQYWDLSDNELAKTTFERVSKMLPGSSEVPKALAFIARREGHWHQSVAYYEQALTLDPRNKELLLRAGGDYGMLRQFPAALKFYDRALDITPDDLNMIAEKAGVYQAEGNLEEASKLLAQVSAQTPSDQAFAAKVTQLRLERNLGEAIQLLQARLAQAHYASDFEKSWDRVTLALVQRLAGDTAGAKVTAEQARNALERLYKDQPDNALQFVYLLPQVYAVLGEKRLALKEAERAVMLQSSAKDPVSGPGRQELLALIQTMFGENSPAISTLTRLLQTSYISLFYDAALTPALLRLDPLWDPLRGDPAFQKLCEEKQP